MDISNRLKVIEKCIEIQQVKSSFYTSKLVKQSDFYPFGLNTGIGVIQKKYLRALSLVSADVDTPKNESLYDTFIDITNTASLVLIWVQNGFDNTRNIFGDASYSISDWRPEFPIRYNGIDALKELSLLLTAKASDYHASDKVTPMDYYIHGNRTIVEELNVKRLRLISLAERLQQELDTSQPDTDELIELYESIQDTLMDMMGYAVIGAGLNMPGASLNPPTQAKEE